MKKFLNIFLILDLIILDQLIKWWVVKYYPAHVYENYGIIFGFIQNSLATYILLGLGIIILIWLIVNKNKKSFNFWHLMPIILITAGALSNLIDRFYRGFVVDYINFFNLNWFNLSDAMIIIGVILYAFQVLRNTER